MKYLNTVFATLILAMTLVSTTEANNSKSMDTGHQRSALIDNGSVFVAGNNFYGTFGDLITNEDQFVEYGQFADAVSVEIEGYRIAVLTASGTLTIQGLWIDGISELGTDIIDFSLSFKSIIMLHEDGSLSEMTLDRDMVNTITILNFEDIVNSLEGGYNNHSILTDNGDLYLDGTFIDSDVEIVEVGKTTTIFKTFSGEVKALNNSTLITESLITDANITNISIGDGTDIYVHFNDGRVFAQGWHNIIDGAVYNNSASLTEINNLFGVISIQSSPSHRLANIENDIYAWAQNGHGEHGVSTGDLVETHSLGFVTTVTDLEVTIEDPTTTDDNECVSHNNGKNSKGNQVDFCKNGFINGKGHHK